MTVNEQVNMLYHTNPVARAVLQTLATLPRQDETLMDDLESAMRAAGTEVDRRKLVNVFKQFEEYGIGRFIAGRKGHRSRFRWECDSLRIGAPEAEATLRPATAIMISHRFHLRPDLALTVDLPSDLTSGEAQRLSQFVTSLPFFAE